MRCLTTLLILLSTMLTAVAQNYQCVQPGKKRYFINDSYYLRGIRIDSVKTIGTTQYLYPFQSFRGMEELDTNGGSWLGKVITVQNDGITYFDNHWGDTTFIHTQAALHDSWLFYTDTTDVYYTATITAIDTATIEGVIDSVKEITLSCYNSSGLLATDKLHGAQLLLSKAHGLAQAFDFYIFPMHEPGKPYQRGFDYTLDKSTSYMSNKNAVLFRLCDFDNPLMTDFYDYNPGDRFVHQYYLGGYPYTTMFDVREKQVMADSIVYGGYSYSQRYVPVQGYGYQTSCVYSNIVAHGTTFLDTSLMPEEWGTRDFYYYNPADTTYCRTGGLYTTHANFILYPDNQVNIFEPIGHQYSYKKGLGVTWHHYQNGSGPINYTEPLTAFAKAGEPQCGPAAVLSVDATKSSAAFRVYPNPANDVLHVEATAVSAQLYDALGRQVGTWALQGDKHTLHTGHLPAGYYVLKIQDANCKTFHQPVNIIH
jgi:hypothetical protein